jgi:hypothetical protein
MQAADEKLIINELGPNILYYLIYYYYYIVTVQQNKTNLYKKADSFDPFSVANSNRNMHGCEIMQDQR